MKVSIVIPVYNVEKYIEECLESAINQTLNDIEIIVVNDGSTDNSLEKVKPYEKKYNNVRIINQTNKGLSGARNTGLRNATGEYIYFLDSDDYISLESMEYCYKKCKENDLDVLTFDAKCFLDEEDANKIDNMEIISKENYDRSKVIESKVVSGEDFYNNSIQNNAYKQPVWLYVYRREFLINENLYFYEGLIHEDELYTIEILLKANRVLYIPKIFFFRRIRFNSIMTQKISKKNIESLRIICDEIYKLYDNNKKRLKSETNSNLITHIRDFYSISMYRMYKSKLNKIEIKQCIVELNESIKKTENIRNTKLYLQFKFPKLYIRVFDLFR